MASGGARARAGRPPEENSIRSAKAGGGDWIELPAAGREGDPPAWPLTSATERELEVWAQEWRRPQALMWERNGQAFEVALYVRAATDAESPRASVSARTLVRQQMDSLGVTVPGLRSNRWKIATVEPESPPTPARRSRKNASARARLEVIQGGSDGAAGEGDT